MAAEGRPPSAGLGEGDMVGSGMRVAVRVAVGVRDGARVAVDVGTTADCWLPSAELEIGDVDVGVAAGGGWPVFGPGSLATAMGGLLTVGSTPVVCS